jgi:hypothetical protein
MRNIHMLGNSLLTKNDEEKAKLFMSLALLSSSANLKRKEGFYKMLAFNILNEKLNNY